MNFFQQNLDLIDHFSKSSNVHKAKNIYFLLIKKKLDGPRQEVAQGRVPSPILCYKEGK